MAYTYHELKAKNIGELREIAKGIEHEAVRGYTQLNKDRLLEALAQALGLSAHETRAAGGFDKAALKAAMHKLSAERDAAREAHDHAKLKSLRRQLHRLNHDIRRNTTGA